MTLQILAAFGIGASLSSLAVLFYLAYKGHAFARALDPDCLKLVRRYSHHEFINWLVSRLADEKRSNEYLRKRVAELEAKLGIRKHKEPEQLVFPFYEETQTARPAFLKD
jgi:hypothetical protein